MGNYLQIFWKQITRLSRVFKNKLDVIFSYSMEEGTKIGTIYEYINYVVRDNFINWKSDFFSLAKNEKIVITYVFTSEIRKIIEHETMTLRWLEHLTFWSGVRRATNCATRPFDYLRKSLTIYQCLSENNKYINLVERKSNIFKISLKKYQHRFYSFVTRNSPQI